MFVVLKDQFHGIGRRNRPRKIFGGSCQLAPAQKADKGCASLRTRTKNADKLLLLLRQGSDAADNEPIFRANRGTRAYTSTASSASTPGCLPRAGGGGEGGKKPRKNNSLAWSASVKKGKRDHQDQIRYSNKLLTISSLYTIASREGLLTRAQTRLWLRDGPRSTWAAFVAFAPGT